MTLASMTGFGRAERADARLAVEVEVRSVNGRHLQLRCRLPGEWARLEPRLEALARKSLRRGAVDLVVRVRVAPRSARPHVDAAVLAVYQKAVRKVGGTADGASLLRLPGVVTLEEPELPARVVEQAVLGAAREALAALAEAREEEGVRIEKALRRELAALRRLARAIARRVPAAVRRQQQALRRRLEGLLAGTALPVGDPTLAREVAVLADRADVTEELDRLESHLVALEERLARGGAVGRELEFLLQEVGREANTLGSKAADAELTARAVELKSGVERLREQVANVE